MVSCQSNDTSLPLHIVCTQYSIAFIANLITASANDPTLPLIRFFLVTSFLAHCSPYERCADKLCVDASSD